MFRTMLGKGIAAVAPPHGAVALFGGLLLLSRAASAEPSREPDETVDAARERGVQLMKEERFLDALRAFEKAHSLSPTPRTLAQRGLAEEALHLWLPAETHVVAALRDAEDPWVAKNRQFLVDAVHEIRRHIGTVVLQLEPSDADVRLTAVGSVVPWSKAEPLRLPEGEIVLNGEAVGFKPWRRRMLVRPGTVMIIPVVLEKDAPLAWTTPLANGAGVSGGQRSSERSRAPAWVAVGMMLAGAAGAAIGGYLAAKPDCGGAGPACRSTDEPRLAGLLILGSGAAIGSSGIVLATW